MEEDTKLKKEMLENWRETVFGSKEFTEFSPIDKDTLLYKELECFFGEQTTHLLNFGLRLKERDVVFLKTCVFGLVMSVHSTFGVTTKECQLYLLFTEFFKKILESATIIDNEKDDYMCEKNKQRLEIAIANVIKKVDEKKKPSLEKKEIKYVAPDKYHFTIQEALKAEEGEGSM